MLARRDSRVSLAFCVVVCAVIGSPPAAAEVRIACVGDSITSGVGVDAKTDAWPARLGAMLGSGYRVGNFGYSGSTLMRGTKQPYWGSAQSRDARAFEPAIVIIKLGTNDTRPIHWKSVGEFLQDYRWIISQFSQLPSKPAIWLCRPVPALPGAGWEISGQQIKNVIVPAIDQLGRELGLPVIDLHTALTGRDDCFQDKVHPNAKGAKAIAEVVYRALKEGVHGGGAIAKHTTNESLRKLLGAGEFARAWKLAERIAASGDGAKADEGKKVVAALGELAEKRYSRIEEDKADDPLGAVERLGELATDFKGTAKGREFASLFAAWKREPAVRKERAARRLLAQMEAAVEVLRKKLNGARADDPKASRRCARDIRTAMAYASALIRRYRGSPSTRRAIEILEEVGLSANVKK